MNIGIVMRTALSLCRFTAQELSEEALTEVSIARASIRKMRRAGMIHISEWRESQKCIKFVAVYVVGEGEDAVKPATLTRKQSAALYRNRTRAELVEKFGNDIARKCTKSRNNGGADAVVIDGITIYRRYSLGPTEGIARYGNF